NHVRIRDNDSVFPRSRGQHLLPQTTFADMKGRGIDIDDHLGPSRRLCASRPFLQPNIFADGHADCRAVDEEQRESPSGTKITAFIEYSVVRQIPFAITTD